MNRKNKLSLLLCFILLFTELFSLTGNAFRAYADQTEEGALPGEEEDNAVPTLTLTINGSQKQYLLDNLEYGPLEGTDGAIVYKSTGLFTLTKNYSANVKFSGGAVASFDLGGHTLTGTEDTATLKLVGAATTITVYSSTSASLPGVITTTKTSIEDEGGLIHNKGSLTLKNIELKSAGGGTTVLHNGGAVMNYKKLQLIGVKITNFASKSSGGAIYNQGTLVIGDGSSKEKLEISGCKDKSGSNSIHNAATITLNGLAVLKDPVVNEGSITADSTENESFYLDGDVVSDTGGSVEAGIFNGIITGGKVQTEGGKVKLRFTVSAGGKNITAALPDGGKILEELTKKGYTCVDAVFPNDGRRAVLATDVADHANRKTRLIEATLGGVKVTFETNCELTVPAQTLVPGGLVTKPTLQREGYFAPVWYTDAAFTKEFDFSTKVSKDMTLYARWIEKTVIPVVVSFDSAGGSSIDSQTMLPGSTATKPLDPVREGYQFNGWYTDTSATKAFDFNTPVTESMKLTAGWKEMKNVVVSFDYGYGTVKRAEIKYNACAVYPQDPEERKDVEFTGWYQDSAGKKLWDFSTRVTANTTIYAGWKEKTKYTVTFDSKGGSAVSSQTVYSGQKAEKPSDPTRETYLFCGWYTDSACKLAYSFDVAVTKSMTLYAKWIEKSVIPVRVSFESNGGSSVADQVIVKGDPVARPADPTRQYYNFSGWYSDQKLTKKYDFTQAVNADLKLYAAWELAPVVPVKVTFDYNGEGSTVTEIIFQNETVPEPEVPTSRTKYFVGWYTDQTCKLLYDFATPVVSDLILYAGWKDKPQYTVSFDAKGGSPAPAKQTVISGEKATKPSDPSRGETYLFCGWCCDEACTLPFDFDTPVTENLTLYARWLEKTVVPVRVSFESNGGSSVATQILVKGQDRAVRPEDPVREMYTFDGWYSDAALTKAYDFTEAVTEDITLYARWLMKPVVPVYVSFDRQDGTEPTVETVLMGDSVSEPEDPVREGYFFLGWYTDKEGLYLWDFSRGISETMTLYAVWYKRDLLTVTFDYKYDSKYTYQSVLFLDPVEKPADPERENYIFTGWCSDSACRTLYDFDTLVTANITLFARWLEKPVTPVCVSFESNGGSTVPDQWLQSGDKAEEPVPTRQYYNFKGWYADQALTVKYDFSKPVTENLKLYAAWELAPVVPVKVTFNYNGQGKDATQIVLQYETVSEPTAPTCETKFFGGWYTDAACEKKRWDFTTPVSEDMTLYARWVDKKQLKVTFDSTGGSAVPEQTVWEEGKAQKPSPDPTRENYIFIGWYSDSTCKKAYDFNSMVLADMTLYARWLEKSVIAVRVSYDSCGGSAVEAEVLARGDKATEPKAPVMEYYTFAGWYMDEACSIEYDFDTPVYEDMTLYARWLFSPVSKVQVIFKYRDGSAEEPETPDKTETVFYGDPVVKPADPKREAFFFTGWYRDEGCTKAWDFGDRIYEDLTLYAGWREKEVYTVSFDANGGSGSIPDQAVYELDTAKKPDEEPTYEGKIFCGWSLYHTSHYKFDFDTPITGNTRLYAIWLDKSVIPLTVEFDSDGGSSVPAQIVASGSNAVRPDPAPTKKGYTFVDWFKKTAKGVYEKFVFETEKITDNLTLVARWLADPVTVVWLTFDSQGGSSIDPQLVEKGQTADWPKENPERTGYHFTGWYEEPECETVFDFDTVLNDDVTVYAGWRAYLDCTVQFDSNGGSHVEDQKVKEGSSAQRPEDPVKENCIFLFWCKDPEFKEVYDFSQPVITDMTLYARWVPGYLNTVTVHFNSNGGSSVTDQKIVRGEKASKPVNPTRSNYRFNGWYIDEDCKSEFNFETSVTEDLTLYAGWTYTGGGGGGGGGGGSSAGSAGSSNDALGPDGKKIGTWKKDDKGWWIEKLDGTWPKSEWMQCTWGGVLNWYYFTPEGYMASGFITDHYGRRYYLHTAQTGSNGAMATGWVQIEGKWYYFNTVSDGSRGAMFVNTTTPDGYKVGADGVWITN